MEIVIPGLPDAPVGSGFKLPDPGRYRLRIMGIDYDTKNPSKPKLVFTYFVVDGPEQREKVPETNSYNPNGMQCKEFVPLQETCAFRMKNIMVAAGVISRDDTTTEKVDTEALLSQEITSEISHKEYDGKIQLNFRHII